MNMAHGSWVILAVTALHACLSCDRDFCLTRLHGSMHCDTADSASYYVCDNGRAKHFTCSNGLVFGGSVCVWPSSGACVSNPVPDVSPGTVVNGYCERTGSDQSSVQGVSDTWYLSTLDPSHQSSCSEIVTLELRSTSVCAVHCLQSSNCHGFKYSNIELALYRCQLLMCPGGVITSIPVYFASYTKLT